MQLFQQQYKIFGSFGASMRNIRDGLAKMANGLLPVIDTEIGLADLRARPGAAGKPPGVRQDRGHVLARLVRHGSWQNTACRAIAPRCRCGVRLPRRANAARRPADRSRRRLELRRRRHAPGRTVAAGAPHRPRQSRGGISGKIARPRSRKSCAASGTISAASAPNSPISTGCGTTIPRAGARAASSIPTKASRSRCGCATTASRR